MECLGFGSSEAVRSLSTCSLCTPLSLSSPKLCATLRPEICVSQLPCTVLASHSDPRAGGISVEGADCSGPSPELRTMAAALAPAMLGLCQSARFPHPPLARGSRGAASVPTAQLTWRRGREPGAWPGPRAGRPRSWALLKAPWLPQPSTARGFLPCGCLRCQPLACAPACSCCWHCAVRAPLPQRSPSVCGEAGGSAAGTAPWSCPGRFPVACIAPCFSGGSSRYYLRRLVGSLRSRPP